MMMSWYKISVVVVVVGTMMVPSAEGQSAPDCATSLIPCFSYLNSTTPPRECCDPLRDAVANDLQCLCNLYTQPGLLPSFGVNITQAALLPRYCGLPGDLSACTGTSAPGPISPTSRSFVPPPPGVGGDNNGVGRIAGGAFVLITSMMVFLF
ncbi:hypothetical protein Leryth_026369 [Lithospermum erythrorhizon]|nr:hypothetical protein Leryth_026369 [Lithospermum erythrorhizon]